MAVKRADVLKLVRFIKAYERSFRKGGVPKKKLTFLDARRKISVTDLLEDFHARVPDLLREVEQGDYYLAALLVGIVRGIHVAMEERMEPVEVDFVSEKKPSKPKRKLHS